MVRQLITIGMWVSILLSFGSVASAAKLKSYCVLPEASKDVTGVNIDIKMPIASVSKLFTSFLATTQNSVTRKSFTQFYYTEVSKDLYDVHIRGGNEPYFGRPAFQWLVAKLNEAGVKKIRRLTFDENFKLLFETDKIFRVGKKRINPVSGKDDLHMPAPATVKLQLERPLELMKGYEQTKKEASANGISLPAKLIYSVAKVEFLEASAFKITPVMPKGYISSPELISMMKLMNWNSNNHAANRIFQMSGGLPAMDKLMYNVLGLTTSDVSFVNGSGQNANLDGDGRLYNEATCRTVVRVVRGLKNALEAQKYKLQDAVAVVGGDIGSTVSGKTYNNKLTNLSVIAKTGTVGTNVTLAGMISAKSGNHFFFFNVEVNSAPARLKNKNAYMNQEANRARKIISTKLNELITRLGGPSQIDYKIKHFDLDNFEEGEFIEEAQATPPKETVP